MLLFDADLMLELQNEIDAKGCAYAGNDAYLERGVTKTIFNRAIKNLTDEGFQIANINSKLRYLYRT